MSSSSICTSNASTLLLGSMAKRPHLARPNFAFLRLLGRARWFWPASTPRGRPGPWAPVPKLGRSSEPPPVKAPLVADAISLPSLPQAWTEELMDSDRRPKGAAANASSVSAFMQARCYRSQPKGIHPVPERLRVF